MTAILRPALRPFRNLALCLALVLAVTACGRLGLTRGSEAAPDTRPPARPEAIAPPPAVGANTAATLDTTTAAQKAAALAPPPAPTGERALGEVAVSLGSPAEPGFWLRAAIVTAPGPGRVEVPGGATLAVELLPGSGAAQLSLPAFRALGLSLTDLPKVTVYAR